MKGAWGEKAARLYLEKRGWHTAATNFRTEKQPRFDVIEVYGEENASVPPCINHLENAFGG